MRLNASLRRCPRLAIWILPAFLAMQASAPAAAECDASVSLVDFGKLDLQEGGDVSGELVVTCDQPGRFSVRASEGLGSYRLRKMSGSDGHELSYNLYVDSAKRSIWGDGVSEGTQTIRGESDGRRPLTIPVYGFVPPRQTVLTGTYSDNLLVTVENL
jgi:spore coat protein U-like protein